jgi:hypothetical protein
VDDLNHRLRIPEYSFFSQASKDGKVIKKQQKNLNRVNNDFGAEF